MKKQDEKRRVGRPLKFETPEKLAEAINKYFHETDPNRYMVTGLCLAIGTSRDVLDEYAAKPDYKEIVKRAKLVVEHSYECRLIDDGGSGPIFGLKNMGWKDRTEVHQEHTYTQMPQITAKTKDGQVKEITFNVGKKRKK